MSTSGKRKVIIDCDAGTDDAAAIIMALSDQNVEVLAVTCVFGNTSVSNVTINVLRVLKLCGRLDIPVYRGCEASMLGVGSLSSGYHGEDGLGDVSDPDPPSTDLLQKQHAVCALLELVDKYKGEITLIPLGPLTNIATALRLEPSFGKKLRKCVVMGGNTEGKGNITITGEFNTFSDPESALVVFNELTEDLFLLPLELCMQHALTWEEYEKLISLSPKAQLMGKWEKKTTERNKTSDVPGHLLFDELAVAAAINEDIIVETSHVYGTVELAGKHTRGQMVWDWRRRTEHKPNIHLVTKINGTLLKEMLFKAYEK